MASVIPADFQPASWVRNPHLQTVWGAMLRRPPKLERRRETLRLADGDHLLLDWCDGAANQAITVIILHGLGGCSRSNYVLGLQKQLANVGIQSVGINSRAACAPNDTALHYHAGETDDLNAVIAHVRQQQPHHRLFAIGISLGGSRLLNWLAHRDSGQLTAAAAVCVPLNLADSAVRLNEGFSRRYQRHLISTLLATHHQRLAHLQQHAPQEAEKLAALRVDNITSFREYDNQIIAPLYGFADAQEYYQRCASGQYLSQIGTPTLLLQSADDPFMYPSSLPDVDELGEHVTLEVSLRGGHVGFIGPRKQRYWLEHHLRDYVLSFTAQTQVANVVETTA